MEEAPLLAAVDGIIRGVQIEPDLLGWLRVGLHKTVHEQAVHARGVSHDLLVTRLGVGIGGCELQAVEGARARQGLALVAREKAILPGGVLLADQHRQQRIQAQPIVVVEVLVAEREPKYPLRHQLPHAVLDRFRIAVVDKLLGEALDDACPGFDLPEQQSAAVGTDVAPIKSAHHRTAAQGVKFQLLGVTLCHRKAALLFVHKMLIAQPLCQRRRPFFNPKVRFPG